MMGTEIGPITSAPVQPDLKSPPANESANLFGPVLAEKLTVSRHAALRLSQRHQSLTAGQWQQLADATKAAGQTGAKQAAIIMPNAIFIVAPPTGTVITAIDRTSQSMQVVSHVDALVLVGRTDKINLEAPASRPTDGGSAPAPLHWSLINPGEL